MTCERQKKKKKKKKMKNMGMRIREPTEEITKSLTHMMNAHHLKK